MSLHKLAATNEEIEYKYMDLKRNFDIRMSENEQHVQTVALQAPPSIKTPRGTIAIKQRIIEAAECLQPFPRQSPKDTITPKIAPKVIKKRSHAQQFTGQY